MRYVLRVVLPLSVAFTGVLVALYLDLERPAVSTPAGCGARPTST